jgi:hypothetical protein
MDGSTFGNLGGLLDRSRGFLFEMVDEFSVVRVVPNNFTVGDSNKLEGCNCSRESVLNTSILDTFGLEYSLFVKFQVYIST